MSQHTPGPWTIGASAGFHERIVMGPKAELIAEIGEQAERTMSNACLIAAAPELLEALNDLWLWASEQRIFLGTSDPVPDGLGKLVMDAIAKAEGAI